MELRSGTEKASTSQEQNEGSEKSIRSSVKYKSCSGSTTSSTTSSVLLKKAKAKAEAARVGQRYVEKEANIARKKAQLDYELQLTKQERAVAEADAELSAIKDTCEDTVFENNDDISETVNKTKLVANYIHNQTFDQEVLDEDREQPGLENEPRLPSKLNIKAAAYVPKVQISQETSDVTRFLLKRDLAISRLMNFNDKPENYVVWKNSFGNIVEELQISPREEVDLMLKYLGTESQKYATSIRFSNVHTSDAGRAKIWARLDDRYGSPELIERSLRDKLDNFPNITGKDNNKLYDLADLLSEILCIKSDPKYNLVLSYFDSPKGINPVVLKLPYNFRNKWTESASKYKRRNNVIYPPFEVFVDFVTELSVRYNDPSFDYDEISTNTKYNFPKTDNLKSRYTPSPSAFTTKKTELTGAEDPYNANNNRCDCPIHGEGSGHVLKDCQTFLQKPYLERKDIIMKHGICFNCLMGKHLRKDCTISLDAKHERNYGGEGLPNINNKCTEICGGFKGKSCAKTILVNVSKDGTDKIIKAYAIIDDQSNRSLARSELFNTFKDSSYEQQYTLTTCAGDQAVSGRIGEGYKIQSLDGQYKFNLPGIIECNQIPNAREEIPTPDVAKHYKHLNDISDKIPKYDENAEILLLIGRDLLSAHHVLDQKIGNEHEPYAQKLKLGWVIVGESCLGLVHKTDKINVNKTNVFTNGRATCMDICSNNFKLQDINEDKLVDIGLDVFIRTNGDDLAGYSPVEKEFMNIMNTEFLKTKSGNWSAPLPFEHDRPRLSNNYVQAKTRFEMLDKSLRKNSTKQKDFLEFMEKIFNNKHAEKAPALKPNEECWYLPIFGVYHNKKKKLRVVFDSAAKHSGLSLNDVLLKGPDLTNSLAAVLLKFRKEKIAITGDDIEQMFFNFLVHEQDRNYLRFLWYEDNDVNKPMTEYRMRVHVFGNKPSPAVANYGLQKSVCNHEDKQSCDSVCDFVKNHFYVDDGLASLQDEQTAIQLIKDTQKRLMDLGNVRLHKLFQTV